MNVVVTGASRGLGRAVALAFARAGHRVLLNFKENKTAAQETADLLRREGRDVLVHRADVSIPSEARGLVEAVVKSWGNLDGLVNNAAVTRDKSILNMTEAQWREVLDVDLSGAFWTLQAAAKVLCRRKDGFILNVGSIVGVKGGAGCANYAAAKAGLAALTKSAALELGRYNVRVNMVLPGFHSTDMGKQLDEKMIEIRRREHALGRFTDTEELARFVVYVAEQKSASGQIYNFDSRIL